MQGMRTRATSAAQGAAALALCALLACSHNRHPVSTANSSHAATPGPEYLIIWAQSPQAWARSYFIERSEQGINVRAEMPGIVFLGPGGVYAWEETSGPRHVLKSCPDPLAPWNDDSAEANPPEVSEVTVHGAVAKRLDAPGAIEISALPTIENATLYDNTITLHAAFGPYLFYSEDVDALYCLAAHDSRSYSVHVFDLAKNAYVDFPTSADSRELREVALRTQRSSLFKCASEGVRNPDGTPSGPEIINSLTLHSAIPKWSNEGQLSFALNLGILMSHVEGYWLPCPADITAVPKFLRQLRVPLGVGEFARRLPQLTVSGWSVLDPAGSLAVTEVEHVFSK